MLIPLERFKVVWPSLSARWLREATRVELENALGHYRIGGPDWTMLSSRLGVPAFRGEQMVAAELSRRVGWKV